ncbi:MAG TPA: hypothetical protein VH561_14005 [Micromonosporaceae bacterium]
MSTIDRNTSRTDRTVKHVDTDDGVDDLLDDLVDQPEDAPVQLLPASALDAVERAFQALVNRRPHPVVFDARDLGRGWPARFIPLDELRDLLVCDRRVSRESRDAAWHQIIDHARTWRQPWIAVAAGLARPPLVAMAEKLRTGREQVIADVESELVTGFIDALLHNDLTGPRPQLRMCWAGWRAALLVREPATWEEVPDLFDPSSRSPTRPYGHPDLLLGRAARLGIIGADDAELISQTRFGRVLVEQLAATRGIDAAALRMRRRRAELKVAHAIDQGVLSGTACDATSAKERNVKPREGREPTCRHAQAESHSDHPRSASDRSDGRGC